MFGQFHHLAHSAAAAVSNSELVAVSAKFSASPFLFLPVWLRCICQASEVVDRETTDQRIHSKIVKVAH